MDERLNQLIKEELEDVKKYMDLYHETSNGIFKDIANEELTHARLLNHLHEDEDNHDILNIGYYSPNKRYI